MSDRVRVHVDDHIATVTLTRPDKLNALDLPMFRAIVAAGEQVAADPSVRAVVLHGEGRGFCAGLDIQSIMATGLPDAAAELLDHRVGPANLAQRVAWVWQEVPVPVIAAVHGAVLGGGLQIALGADVRICAPDAKLAVRELHWGLIPDMGISKTLLGVVSADVARLLTFTADQIDAEQALAYGLITRIAEDPVAEATAIARTICGRNPEAVRASKRLLKEAPQLSVEASFELETELQRPLLGSPNQLEAAVANFTKRAPVFQ